VAIIEIYLSLFRNPRKGGGREGLWRPVPTLSSLPDDVAFFSVRSQMSGQEGLKDSRRVESEKRRRGTSIFPPQGFHSRRAQFQNAAMQL
jgi:hypothetical protein